MPNVYAVLSDNGLVQAHSTSRSILVAEDNEGLRALFRKVLEHEGYSVMEAANGREVMNIFRRAKLT